MSTMVTTDRWSALAAPPSTLRTRIGARVSRSLFRAAVLNREVSVELHESDGVVRLGLGGPAATILRPDEFFARLGRDGLIGFGEAYMTGAWESDDLVAFLSVLARDMAALIPPRLQRLRALAVRRIPRRHRNTREGSRQNIAHHYDLSNDLFALFLDSTMTYSSGLFETGAFNGEVLREAQERKIDRLLDEAAVGTSTRLLEIGTGWGELAIRAAQRGAQVRTITLSEAQKALAEERVAAAGVADRVVVDLCDYRDVQGTYDAVVSVEMIEAVGWQFWPAYFEKIEDLLTSGGRAAIQAITMPHDRMLASRGTHTWITKYIFPGGALPSVQVLEDIAQSTGLRMVGRFDFGLHYAATLRQWDATFMAARDEVARLGFDATFQRMWHFYLAYCEAGFAAEYINVNQLTFVNEGERVR